MCDLVLELDASRLRGARHSLVVMPDKVLDFDELAIDLEFKSKPPSTSIRTGIVQSVSTSISMIPSPVSITGKLRDAEITMGDRVRSGTAETERRRFSFCFPLRVPDTDDLMSPDTARFFARIVSSTLTLSETPFRVCKNCVGSEYSDETGVDETEVESWDTGLCRNLFRDMRAFTRGAEADELADEEDDGSEKEEPEFSAVRRCCVR